MKIRKIVIGAAVVTVGVPVVLILIVVVSVAVLDRTNGTIVSSGKPLSYLLYVPRSHDRAKPTPLVISMHGAAGWPAQQMNLSRWNRLAESQGFFVVYPSGSDVPKIWHVDRGAGLMRDVGFISAGGGLQHRPDEDLCQRDLRWRRHGVCAVLHAVRSDRGGRDGGGCAIVPVELV